MENVNRIPKNTIELRTKPVNKDIPLIVQKIKVMTDTNKAKE